MFFQCDHDSSCNVGEYCGLGNAGYNICMPCGKCSDYKRLDGSTNCPKSGHDCGPCEAGLFLEDLSSGGQSPKCRPIQGYKPPTDKASSAGMGAEDIMIGSDIWYKSPMFIYGSVGILCVALIVTILCIGYKCRKNINGGKKKIFIATEHGFYVPFQLALTAWLCVLEDILLI